MLPYFLLFALPTMGAIFSSPDSNRREAVLWISFGVIMAFMIGFRYRVGADWGWLQYFFQLLYGKDFGTAIRSTDPAYGALMWLVANSGLNVWVINLVGGTVFAFGLLRFCRYESSPWITAVVAVPYLVTVVAMGYDRQAVAIGFVMIGLVSLQQGSFRWFAAMVVAAASCHISALLVAPIGLLGYRRMKVWQLVVVSAVGVAMALYMALESAQQLADAYFMAQYDSSGAVIRVSIVVSAAVGFFLLRRKLVRNVDEMRLWTAMSVGAILLVPMFWIVPSSTAVDRLGLYFLPLELFVFGRLPSALARSPEIYQVLMAMIIIFSGVELYVWLRYADTAFTWLPYQLFPWNALTGSQS